MHVMFCASEVFPYAKTGGLADVCGALPLALNELGINVSIMMPYYGELRHGKFQVEKIQDGLYAARFSKQITAYFVDCPEFFDRPGLYGDETGDYADNFERFDYFNRRVLRFLETKGTTVDIIHCHDWQTALIPVYLKFRYGHDPVLRRIKTVFTVHNLAYQGLFPKEFIGKFDFDADEVLQKAGFYFYGKLSFLRAGIVSADSLTTVSPQYAREIQTEAYGCGMHDVLAKRGDLVGILNGIDYSIWDPEHDGLIAARYSDKAPEGKLSNKKEVQLLSNLPPRSDVPLFSFIGRLSHQKGIDLIAEAVSTLLENDIQIVFMGQGNAESQRKLLRIADQYPNKVAIHLVFDEMLAHQIYAGSDFFLMPSVYEPCGLSQMISLCYGTIPIVFNTGGLADTVHDISSHGNGIVFQRYVRDDFVKAIFRAIELYADQAQMNEVMANAFSSRFPWRDSARRYRELYQTMLGE